MKRVTFVPRHVAEAMKAPEGALLISIAHPGERPDINHWPNRQGFQFDDIETPVSGSVMFGIEDAQTLQWMLSCVRPDVVYVHCEAGMSRSAAVAMWLHYRRGYDLWLHPEGVGTAAHYNRHVYRTLDAAEGNDLAAYYAELERQERMME